MTVRVFDPAQCYLGEGPLWHPTRNSLIWFDIMEKRMLERANIEQKESKCWIFDEYVSAAGIVDDDTIIVASQTALSRLNLTNGSFETLVPLEADTPVTRSNDGRADPYGGFWIGTMGVFAETDA